MDLHAMVADAIGAVNPFIDAALKTSTGYTVGADGTQAPSYSSTPVSIQVQELNAKEIEHLLTLNIQGTLRKVYAEGNYAGVIRKSARGGDLLTFGGDTWKVIHVFETWPDWCAVGIQLQVD